MNNKITYKVFHLDGDSETSKRRAELYDKIQSYLNGHYNELDTPTIKISNQEEYDEWLINNPDFYINGHGCDIQGFEGWRFGEVGIWASNFTAWKKFLDTDYEYLVLMEDDIIFTSDFSDLLENYMSQLPEGWDLFSFFSPEDQHHKFNMSHDIGKEDISRVYQDWSMLCYVLSRRGAEKALLSMPPGITLSLDWHFYRQPHIFNEYSIKPRTRGGCHLAPIESTFQTTQDRNFLNGNIRS